MQTHWQKQLFEMIVGRHSGEKNTGPLTRGKHTDTRWRSWPTKHADRSFLLYKSTGLLPPKIQQFYVSVLSVSVSVWKLDLLLPMISLNSSFYIYWETKWMQSCLGVWSLYLLSVTTARRKHDTAFCLVLMKYRVKRQHLSLLPHTSGQDCPTSCHHLGMVKAMLYLSNEFSFLNSLWFWKWGCYELASMSPDNWVSVVLQSSARNNSPMLIVKTRDRKGLCSHLHQGIKLPLNKLQPLCFIKEDKTLPHHLAISQNWGQCHLSGALNFEGSVQKT